MLNSAFRRLAYTRASQGDPALAAELRERFAPEVARLGEMLDRDLPGYWGSPGRLA